jgi:hypothetical protein
VSPPNPPGPPPRPPSDLSRRSLPIHLVAPGSLLYRIHRSGHDPLHFGRPAEPVRRQRWDAPDAAYGVCYLAFEGHIAFVETLLRDLALDNLHAEDLHARSIALVRVAAPLRLVAMSDRHLRRLGADASVVHGPYEAAWAWSAAFHGHDDAPDGIRYRARHDDSGFSVALFERSRSAVSVVHSTPLTSRSVATEVGAWLDRYAIGLTT